MQRALAYIDAKGQKRNHFHRFSPQVKYGRTSLCIGESSRTISLTVEPPAKRQVAEIMAKNHRISISRACGLVRLSRTAWYRRPSSRRERDGAVIDALLGLVEAKPRWGFWKLFPRLRRLGHPWNHKRVHRVYCALKLNLPRRTKRRLPKRLRQPLWAPDRLNEIWALDFMADALYGGRAFRTLNVIDEGNREALGIEVATSIPSLRVIRVMEQLIEIYGCPRALRMDNGSELTAIAFTEWCEKRRIEVKFIEPGKPDQNAYIERFNRSYRNEVLDAYVFDSIDEMRQITEIWLREYNYHRPHGARWADALRAASGQKRLCRGVTEVLRPYSV